MEVPQDEFRIPFFNEKGFLRKLCPSCGLHFWTQNPDANSCGDAPCADYTFIGDPPSSKKLTMDEMREKFLSFFEERGHKRINPYPIVARWRDDLMVTIASIIDFQPYVTEGILPPPANPLVISQPCLRFEDIDLVGLTAGRHLTIFEMGGHHAFNYRDKPEIYWKNETVRLHHELLTGDLKVPSELITYKEGLWSGGGNAGFDLEGCVSGIELSTLVFMMYRVVGERFEPMPIKVVDTGYGIERWAWFSQGKPSAFHTVYGPVLRKVMRWAGLSKVEERVLEEAAKCSCIIKPEDLGAGRRRLAGILGMDVLELEELLSPVEGVYAALDHSKAMIFILSEGVVPSNVREGYLARLLFRRSFRLLRRARIENKLIDLVEAQIEYWGKNFPQLKEMGDEIIDMITVEGKKYMETLNRGAGLVKRYLQHSKHGIPVNQLVEFYDSHGLTPDDVKEAASDVNVNITPPENFYALVTQRHMMGREERHDEEKGKLSRKLEHLDRTKLLFYESPYKREFEAEVIDVIDDKYVVLDRSIFYSEGGGQISDTGWLTKGSDRVEVADVRSVEGVLLHEIKGRIPFKIGDLVDGTIDWERRLNLMRSHTATHLLLGAARRVLGDHAWQAGAQKGVERSRIDISHNRRLTRQQIESIERLSNQVVFEGRHVSCKWMPRNEAEENYGFRLYQGGAVPGKELRVVEVEGWDVEACGGTHVHVTSEVGLIKILKSERVQDGVERIEFTTGPNALKTVQGIERTLLEMADILDAPLGKLKEAASNTIESMKGMRYKLDRLIQTASKQTARDLLEKAEKVEDVKVIVDSIEAGADFIIEVGNVLSQHDDPIVAVVHSEVEPRVVVTASEAAIALGVHSGKLVSEVADIIGGGGGGEQHFGQGGGGNLVRFQDEKRLILKAVEDQLK